MHKSIPPEEHTMMKKVLVIGYVWPEPRSSAAGSHMLSLLRLFTQQHWEVVFASAAESSIHAVDLEAEGIKSQPIVLNCDSFDRFVAGYSPDIVVFDRFMTEEQFGWRVEKNCPLALKILDTEDLQCLRNARHQALKENREMGMADLYSDLAKREIAAIFRSDISLIISSYEMDLLQQTFGVDISLLYHLPFMVDLEQCPDTTQSFSQRKHFISIGNFRHAPNWDMVLYLQQLWPAIRKRLPDAQLHIYGSYPPPKATALHNPKTGFHIKGWVDDALRVMAQSRVCLAPLRFGAGIKGKLLDALITQTPSVTTSVGIEGMCNEEPWAGAVSDNADDFVNEAVALYSDEQRWRKAQENGMALLHARYDAKILGEILITKITQVQQNLTAHRLQNFTGAMLKHHSMASTKYMSQWIAEKNKSLKP